MNDLNAALASLRSAVKSGKTAPRKEAFRFPAGHVFIVDSDNMNALLDICRTLYNHEDRCAPKMYAILRGATPAKL